MASGKFPMIGQFYNHQKGSLGSMFQNEMLFHMYTRTRQGFCAKCDLEPQNISEQEGYKLPGHIFHSKASQFVDPLFPNWQSDQLFVETYENTRLVTKLFRYDTEGHYLKNCLAFDRLLGFFCGAEELSLCCKDFLFSQDSQVGLQVVHQFGCTEQFPFRLQVANFQMNLENISSVPLYVVNSIIHGYIVFARFRSESISMEDIENKVKLFGKVIENHTQNLPTELTDVRDCTILIHIGSFWDDWNNTKEFKNFESAIKHIFYCSEKMKKIKLFRGVELDYGMKGLKNYERSMICEGNGASLELIKNVKRLPLWYISPPNEHVSSQNVYKLYFDVTFLFKEFQISDSYPIRNLAKTFHEGFQMFQRKLGMAVDAFVTEEGPKDCFKKELDEFMNSKLSPEKVISDLQSHMKSSPDIPFSSVTYSSEPKKDVLGANALLAYVCPYSWAWSCPFEFKKWACGVCGQLVRFNPSSETVNCHCGSVAFEACGFRCNRPMHRPLPIEQPLITRPPRAEITCLLIGESGSGKSTFLNSLVNYFLYTTLDESAHKDPVFLIPTAYTNYMETIPVSHPFGSDDNEQLLEGRTHTINFRSYIVPLEGATVLRFIDSPGFDSESDDTDSHVKSYLEVASRHRDIHAICWVIDCSQRKLSKGFVSAFRQMTSILTLDQRKSCGFVFTHFTKQPVNFLLVQQVTDLQGELDPVFKLNNEAFPHLVSRLAGQSIQEYDLPRLRYSWAESSRVSKELCDWLITMEPRSFYRHFIKQELDYNPMEEVVFEAQALKVSCMLQLKMSGLSLHLPCNIRKEEEDKAAEALVKN